MPQNHAALDDVGWHAGFPARRLPEGSFAQFFQPVSFVTLTPNVLPIKPLKLILSKCLKFIVPPQTLAPLLQFGEELPPRQHANLNNYAKSSVYQHDIPGHMIN